MKYSTLFTMAFAMFFSLQLMAQTGTLRGTVYDDTNGETVPFATIFINETGGGTTTDLDGAYELNLAPGKYNLKISFIGYADYMVSDVIIIADKVELLDIRMKEEGETIETVVVTAKQARNSEVALATIRRKSVNLLDGVTSQTFEKTGDSNAAEALQRVTGVSIEGGKHVYVRGLGDRYTKTILNGMDIPGLDPDKNSFEMDLLPTNLIDNILVFKSFTPDLPGEFTGGMVNVITKDFPEEKFTKLSIGMGYNPDMHFNSNFIRQERSQTDFLGFDDGMRALPIPKDQIILNPALNDNITNRVTRRFQDNAGIVNATNNLNKSISFATGNQIKRNEVKYSYIFSANYKNNSSFYENAEFNTFIFDEQNFPGQFRLINDREITGSVGEESVLLSGLLGGAIKYKNHRIGLQAMRLQNGISKVASQEDAKSQSSSALLKREILEYAERSVTNINLNGRHLLKNGKFEINWSAAPTFIEVDEPDIRFTAFERLEDGTFQIAPAVGADISRTWRNLKEVNYSGKTDFMLNLGKDNGKTNKIKFGFLGTFKERDFGIQNYIFRIENQSSLNLNGQAANIFNEDNIWSKETNTGVYVKGGFEPANTFNASQTLLAGYVMNEIEISKKFKAIYGARVEKATNIYSGQNNAGTLIYEDEKVLDELNVLPSLNLVYAAGEKSNIRTSYTKTVARPSFKENSIAQIQDRISGRIFIGNIDLKQTEVDNVDIRFEKFGQGGETFSVSGFYKHFKNPIELESFSDLVPNNFQPKNIAETANVYGVEFETIKKLGFLGDFLSGFTLGTNITVVKSEVERSNAEELPEGEQNRPMVGQSPFVVNASLAYKNSNNGFEAALAFNRQAKKLLIAGFGSNADIYDQPFNSLNIKTSKKFGVDNKFKVSLSVENILGDRREKFYEAFSGDVGVFEGLNPGRMISFGFSTQL
ncbi:MAG: TonB-dependent receptor [Saprospiraceae bacterium]|nr:TonB-dependent receptor [Saprospiraceae bacterium]